MKLNEIAKTGLTISELGLGCASLAGIFSAVPREQASATIAKAWEKGIRYFDTAPFYGHGRSERLTGDGIRGHDYVLSTKVGRLLRPGAMQNPGAWVDALPFTPVFDYSRDAILRSFEDSLQRLGLARIDILYMHDIGNYTHGDEEGPKLFKIAMGEGYAAMDMLRREGYVKAIGLGVNETEVCMNALDYGDWDAFLLAGRYTLLEQAPLDDLFPKCTAQGTDIIVGGPFNSGVLVGGETFDYGAIPEAIASRIRGITAICDDHGVPLPAAALQFCRAHPIVKSTIPGPRTPQELEQILAWWNTPVPTAFWSDLKSAGLLRGDAPVPA